MVERLEKYRGDKYTLEFSTFDYYLLYGIEPMIARNLEGEMLAEITPNFYDWYESTDDEWWEDKILRGPDGVDEVAERVIELAELMIGPEQLAIAYDFVRF